VPDPSFLAAAPDATAWVVAEVGDVVVVGGSEAGSARPAALASAGAGSWVGLPPELTEGQEGGGIVLSAAVGSNVVLMGGGPVASTPGGAAPPAPSRFFVLRSDQVPEPTPAATVEPGVLSLPGESATELAERITTDVLDDPMVTTGVEDDGELHLVTLRSSTGVVAVATITGNRSGSFRFEGLTTTGLSIDGTRRLTAPEPGTLTIIGYDGDLTPPGEVMVDQEPVTGAGVTEPFDLVESSWLRLDLTTLDGRILHQLAPR
jgi:hypothetical protein